MSLHNPGTLRRDFADLSADPKWRGLVPGPAAAAHVHPGPRRRLREALPALVADRRREVARVLEIEAEVRDRTAAGKSRPERAVVPGTFPVSLLTW